MSLFRFMSIAVVAIAIAVVVVSNLTDAFQLVFWTARTVSIPLGLLALGAGSIGILASVLLRLLASRPRREPKADRRAAQPEFESEPEEPFRPVDRPLREPEPAEPEEYRSPVVSKDKALVYDANYRVISAPKNPVTPKPQVNSKLKSDAEDWGFDFEEDDG